MADVSSFKARYQEFQALDDALVTVHLTECMTLLSADKYGSKYEQCLYLLTAHELKLLELGVDDSEVIVSRSIEGGSVTFKNLATDERQLYYSKTAYGQKFLAIKKTVRFVGSVCE